MDKWVTDNSSISSLTRINLLNGTEIAETHPKEKLLQNIKLISTARGLFSDEGESMKTLHPSSRDSVHRTANKYLLDQQTEAGGKQ